jgi:hypothetical protein
MSDSLMLEITGEGRDRLIAALDLCAEERVTGIMQGANRLLLSYEHDGQMRMNFPPSLMADVAIEWLKRTPGSNRAYLAPTWPDQPNIDGSCKKGWRLVFAHGGPIEIHPHWMVYHK